MQPTARAKHSGRCEAGGGRACAVEAVDADGADPETTLQKADPKGCNAPGHLSPRSCSLVKKGDEQVLRKC